MVGLIPKLLMQTITKLKGADVSAAVREDAGHEAAGDFRLSALYEDEQWQRLLESAIRVTGWSRKETLDHLAEEFEPGRVYPESEVNEVLQGFHPDHAALRRYLVEDQFLSREGGHYWRSGGTVDV